jgi:hypothetical protein
MFTRIKNFVVGIVLTVVHSFLAAYLVVKTAVLTAWAIVKAFLQSIKNAFDAGRLELEKGLEDLSSKANQISKTIETTIRSTFT